MKRYELCDGKYTIEISQDFTKFIALRYGEEWRNLCGDGLILSLCQRIDELEAQLCEEKIK